MKLIIILAILLIFPLQVCAEEITFNGWSTGNGKLFQNITSLEELSTLPSWNPEDGAPPLSPQQAVNIAKEYLSKKHPNFINAKVGEIKLSQFLIPRYCKDKWCYIIIFFNNIQNITRRPDILNVVVMLDGSINIPIEIKK